MRHDRDLLAGILLAISLHLCQTRIPDARSRQLGMVSDSQLEDLDSTKFLYRLRAEEWLSIRQKTHRRGLLFLSPPAVPGMAQAQFQLVFVQVPAATSAFHKPLSAG